MREELIASSHTEDEIRRIIDADSIGYLSLENLRRVSETLKHGICDACFSDEYVVASEVEEELPQLSLFREVEDEGRR